MVLLSLLFLLPSATCYKVAEVGMPNVLLDIRNSDVLERCNFRNLVSVAPVEIIPGIFDSHLTFNLTLIKPTRSIHVIFDGKEPLGSQVTRTLDVIINGSKQKLNLRPVRSASMALVDHSKLQNFVNLTVKMLELQDINATLNDIFLITDIDENCEAWKKFSSDSSLERKGLGSRYIGKRGVIGGCERIPMEVDLRDIRRADDEEDDEFIYTPMTYDVGTCGNRCLLGQLSPYALLRSILRENIELGRNHTAYHHKVSEPICTAISYGPLQVITFNRVDNVMKIRTLEKSVVKECGCV